MTADRERSREVQPFNHTGHFSSRTCLVPLGRGVGAWRLIELPGSRTFPGGVSRSENFWPMGIQKQEPEFGAQRECRNWKAMKLKSNSP